MIITREQLKEVTGCDYYDGSIFKSKFAYRFLGSKMQPLGNIISFIAPAIVSGTTSENNFKSDNMVNFLMEIPNVDIWGAVVFQRLYNSIIANILSDSMNCQAEVEDGNIFLRKEVTRNGVILSRGVVSMTNVSVRQDSALIYTGINLIASPNAPAWQYSTSLNPHDARRLQVCGEEAFGQTIGSIFYATCKATS